MAVFNRPLGLGSSTNSHFFLYALKFYAEYLSAVMKTSEFVPAHLHIGKEIHCKIIHNYEILDDDTRLSHEKGHSCKIAVQNILVLHERHHNSKLNRTILTYTGITIFIILST
ncbi:hypothetical protein SLE2022_389680 [Rubroshorea leprosula]